MLDQAIKYEYRSKKNLNPSMTKDEGGWAKADFGIAQDSQNF